MLPPSALPLQVAAPRLFDLDRLEQCLEVADAEAARAMALDDLEEERWAILDRAGEDLEEVALLVAIGLDAQLFEGRDRHANVADAVGEGLVVGVGHAEELDAVLAQLPDGADDVLGAQRDVLGPVVQVVVEELLDLALLLARGGLVDRGLDPAVAVWHELR